jgi:glutaredoxin
MSFPVISKEVYPLPVILFGRSTRDGTVRLRQFFENLNISFVEIDVDADPDAARYVDDISHGERKTPTIIFGRQDQILVTPTRDEVSQSLRIAGYEIGV